MNGRGRFCCEGPEGLTECTGLVRKVLEPWIWMWEVLGRGTLEHLGCLGGLSHSGRCRTLLLWFSSFSIPYLSLYFMFPVSASGACSLSFLINTRTYQQHCWIVSSRQQLHSRQKGGEDVVDELVTLKWKVLKWPINLIFYWSKIKTYVHWKLKSNLGLVCLNLKNKFKNLLLKKSIELFFLSILDKYIKKKNCLFY